MEARGFCNLLNPFPLMGDMLLVCEKCKHIIIAHCTTEEQLHNAISRLHRDYGAEADLESLLPNEDHGK